MAHEDRKSCFKKYSRRQFLQEVKQRLENDVSPYLGLIVNKGIGFWASVRMVFPVIEAVANVIFRRRKKRPKNDTAVRLLGRLGIQYPEILWEMYRHSLIHGDELRCAQWGKNIVTWEIGFGNNHTYTNKHISMDMQKFYNDFLSFLDREITVSGNKIMLLEDRIQFIKKKSSTNDRNIIREIKEISSL